MGVEAEAPIPGSDLMLILGVLITGVEQVNAEVFVTIEVVELLIDVVVVVAMAMFEMAKLGIAGLEVGNEVEPDDGFVKLAVDFRDKPPDSVVLTDVDKFNPDGAAREVWLCKLCADGVDIAGVVAVEWILEADGMISPPCELPLTDADTCADDVKPGWDKSGFDMDIFKTGW